jgi:hypothetical protein
MFGFDWLSRNRNAPTPKTQNIKHFFLALFLSAFLARGLQKKEKENKHEKRTWRKATESAKTEGLCYIFF